MGKQLPSKIALGNSAGKRLVDTEITPADQHVRFSSGGAYLTTDEVTTKFPVGTQFWVQKVDLKDDRIELGLNSVSRNDRAPANTARLKLMLGRNYQQAADSDSVLALAARALKIESYERALALGAEFNDLKSKLPSLEGQRRSATTTSAKVAATTALRDANQKLAANRAAYAASGRPAPGAEQYQAAVKQLDGELKDLETVARRDKVQQLHAHAQAQASQLGSLRQSLTQKPPTNMPDWQARSTALEKYRVLLEERQSLYNDLRQNGEAPTATEANDLVTAQKEAETWATALAEQKRAAQLNDLNSAFQMLQRKRGQLVDGYVKAFNTPQERRALQALQAHLQLMYDNRNAARQLGDSTAGNQANQLRADIEKLRKR